MRHGIEPTGIYQSPSASSLTTELSIFLPFHPLFGYLNIQFVSGNSETCVRDIRIPCDSYTREPRLTPTTESYGWSFSRGILKKYFLYYNYYLIIRYWVITYTFLTRIQTRSLFPHQRIWRIKYYWEGRSWIQMWMRKKRKKRYVRVDERDIVIISDRNNGNPKESGHSSISLRSYCSSFCQIIIQCVCRSQNSSVLFLYIISTFIDCGRVQIILLKPEGSRVVIGIWLSFHCNSIISFISPTPSRPNQYKLFVLLIRIRESIPTRELDTFPSFFSQSIHSQSL